ncbi:MAG TPA: RNA polymerase sigma factor RpoD/SigA [Thermoleophilaceae bacterium]|nr:RNA polymerase sigma factor RpoD/SigA [Thermoleophilaceae bacterium]
MRPEEHLQAARPPAIEQFAPEEAEAIHTEAWRRRILDRELADALDEREPTAHAATSRYLHEVAGRPSLAPPKEHDLVRAAQRGDGAAKARLIEAFLPLIASRARIYRNTQALERIELIQEGVVGLLRALECYDPTRGTPFGAYASWWVRQAMQRLVAELTRPVVLSDRALRQLARVNDAHREQLQKRGREPSLAELAAATGLTREQVESLIAADRAPRALEEPVAGEQGRVGALGDLVVDPLAEDDYERVVSRLQIEELRGLLSGLSDRERAVLRARYGLDGPEQTLREIGAHHGLSAERVRQVERRALGKLRAAAGPAAVDGPAGHPGYEIETFGLPAGGAPNQPSEIQRKE